MGKIIVIELPQISQLTHDEQICLIKGEPGKSITINKIENGKLYATINDVEVNDE